MQEHCQDFRLNLFPTVSVEHKTSATFVASLARYDICVDKTVRVLINKTIANNSALPRAGCCTGRRGMGTSVHLMH